MFERIKTEFGCSVSISGENAGLHLLARFARPFNTKDRTKFLSHQVDVDFAQQYALCNTAYQNDLVLGYGSLSETEIIEGIRRIGCALK